MSSLSDDFRLELENASDVIGWVELIVRFDLWATQVEREEEMAKGQILKMYLLLATMFNNQFIP